MNNPLSVSQQLSGTKGANIRIFHAKTEQAFERINILKLEKHWLSNGLLSGVFVNKIALR